MLRVHSCLVLLTLVGCHSRTTPYEPPPLAVPATERPAAPRPASERAPDEENWEAYVEPVELDGKVMMGAFVQELTAGYALVSRPMRRDASQRELLHLDTLEVIAFPAFAGDPFAEAKKKSAAATNKKPGWKKPGRRAPEVTVRFYGLDPNPLILAAFTDEANHRISFQVLTLATMQWELAGEFEIPRKRDASKHEVKRASTYVYVQDGVAQLRLSDGFVTRRQHELDPETFVWKKSPDLKASDEPCLMSSKLEEDLVRWGMPATPGADSPSCIAVRKSESESWQFLEDPAGPEPTIIRAFHRIDETRVLVTGGVQFKLFPFARRADVVDLEKPEIRPMGKPRLGHRLEVPGERYLWAEPGTITRFDPESESFYTEPAPELGFEHRWQVRLDERTVLYGRADKDVTKFAKFGFRPKGGHSSSKSNLSPSSSGKR